MIAEGLLKITAQVNPLYFENSIVALVGMRLEKSVMSLSESWIVSAKRSPE